MDPVNSDESVEDMRGIHLKSGMQEEDHSFGLGETNLCPLNAHRNETLYVLVHSTLSFVLPPFMST